MKIAKINNKHIVQEFLRFDPTFHLSDSIQLKEILSVQPYRLSTVGEQSKDIFFGNIFSRIFVQDEKFGVPYMTASDMMKSDINSGKFIAKRQAEKLHNLIIKKDWILISCSGTLGNVIYTNELFENKMGTHDLIRIIPQNGEVKSGFLYAYLASKYGYTLLTQSSFGGVIKHINPEHVANIPVPIFPQEKQEQIHNLITEAAQLRVEANRLLEEAVEMLSNFIGLDFQEKEKLSGKVSLKEIYQSLSTRIDPPTFINNGVKAMEIIRDSGRELVSLSEIDGITVYRPGIFKRNYVEKGLPYIKGSELFNINPFVRCDNLSKTKTPFVDEMALKENQILITCAGSCGLVKVITKEYEEREAIGSQDIIRLQSENVLFTSEYLFVYLQLPFVYDYIQSMKYGSVIERIEPFHVQSIPVVVPTEELSANITSLITNYKNNVYQAFSNENQAISLVENEIALWQS